MIKGKINNSKHRIRDSIVAIIPACHAGDPSSILGRGDFFILSIFIFFTSFTTLILPYKRYLLPMENYAKNFSIHQIINSSAIAYLLGLSPKLFHSIGYLSVTYFSFNCKFAPLNFC